MMLKKSLAVLCIMAVVGTTLLTGCSVEGESTKTQAASPDKEGTTDQTEGGATKWAGKDKLTIGVMLPGMDSQYWNMNVRYGAFNGAASASEKFGVDVNLVVQGAPSESDVTSYVNTLENLIASEDLDGLIVVSLNADPVGPIVTSAAEQGIFVNLGFFKVTTDDSNWHTVTRINQPQVGQMAAEEFYRQLESKGLAKDGVVGVFNAGINDTLMLMLDGFRTRLLELCPTLTILDTQFNEGDITKGMAQVENTLATYGDDLVGFYGANNVSGNAVARVLAENDLGGKLVCIGVDADQEELTALDAGLIDALIVKRSYSNMYELVEMTVESMLTGKEFERDIVLDPKVFTKADYDSPDSMEPMYQGDVWPEKFVPDALK